MILFNKEKHSRLKHKFESSETIETNFSQAYQDMFALTMLNGKKNGTYLEIGSFDPIFINNTYLLENKFGWKGISIDIDPAFAVHFAGKRKNPFIAADAVGMDYEQLFKEFGYDTRIDYLTLDIEPHSQTLACLKKLPLDKYRFSVITFETDYYDKSEGVEEAERIRTESRELLKSYGYELVVGNLANTSTTDIFEDWYVDPTVIDATILETMRGSSEFNNPAENHMLI